VDNRCGNASGKVLCGDAPGEACVATGHASGEMLCGDTPGAHQL